MDAGKAPSRPVPKEPRSRGRRKRSAGDSEGPARTGSISRPSGRSRGRAAVATALLRFSKPRGLGKRHDKPRHENQGGVRRDGIGRGIHGRLLLLAAPWRRPGRYAVLRRPGPGLDRRVGLSGAAATQLQNLRRRLRALPHPRARDQFPHGKPTLLALPSGAHEPPLPSERGRAAVAAGRRGHTGLSRLRRARAQNRGDLR